MSGKIDQPQALREGETVDLVSLAGYLQNHLSDFTTIVSLAQFPGGFSNLTYLLTTNVGEFVLRRPPHGANIKSAHDMGREYHILTALRGYYDRIPTPVLYCTDAAILGAPFYLMERVRGRILRQPKQAADLSAQQMKDFSTAVIHNLARLHETDIQQSGLIDLGKPAGYVARQVSGWTDRYERAATDTIPAMHHLAHWMKSNQPADGPPALIHNDYKYDNLLVDPSDPTHILAVLDWEMATVGDPRMDLGTTLAYWTEAAEAKAMPLAAANPTWLPGNLNRKEVARCYAEQTGADLSHLLFYYVYGTFKIAVILQQIYARYRQGATSDERFAALIHAVRHFSDLGQRALEKDRISDLFTA